MTQTAISSHNVIATSMKLRRFKDFTRLEIKATSDNGVEVSWTLYSDKDSFPMPVLEVQPDVKD